jgi:hypothetical protein
VLRGVPEVEIPLVAVQPGEGIVDAVVLGELHLVGGREGILLLLVLAATTIRGRAGRCAGAAAARFVLGLPP